MIRPDALLVVLPLLASACATHSLRPELVGTYCVIGAPQPSIRSGPEWNIRHLAKEQGRGLPWDLGGKLELSPDGTFRSYMPGSDPAMWFVAAGTFDADTTRLRLNVDTSGSKHVHPYRRTQGGMVITSVATRSRPWTLRLVRCAPQTLLAVPPRLRPKLIAATVRRIADGLSPARRELVLGLPDEDLGLAYHALREELQGPSTRAVTRACLCRSHYDAQKYLAREVRLHLRRTAGRRTVNALDREALLARTLVVSLEDLEPLGLDEAIAFLNDRIADFVRREPSLRDAADLKVVLAPNARPRRREFRGRERECEGGVCSLPAVSLHDAIRYLAGWHSLDAYHLPHRIEITEPRVKFFFD